MYYNSTPIQGDLLAQARRIAGQQDKAVMKVFEDGQPHTPSDVWATLVNGGRNLLLTSVRRSITSMEHAGALATIPAANDDRMTVEEFLASGGVVERLPSQLGMAYSGLRGADLKLY